MIILPEKDTLCAMFNVPVQCNKYFKTNSFKLVLLEKKRKKNEKKDLII